MKKHIKFTVAAITLCAFGTYMLAQDGVQPAADSAKKIVGVEEISAFDFLIKGGVFLIPIALLLFYTIFLAVEKYLYIRRTAKHDKNLLADIRTSLNSGNLDNAITIVSRDKTAFGSIVKEGILTIGRPVSEIESNMEKVTNIEIAKMERNLGHLGLIAGIAPTLGFIGTISGVIKIFYSISITENVSIGNISAGLYEKMISSGSGLIVGIVAFAVYHILNAIIDNFSLHAQKVNLDFVNIIQRPGHGDQTK
ncbi:MAG: MotA/TolQ/ExbB proton channel family protein [Bacteroidota bacterium]